MNAPDDKTDQRAPAIPDAAHAREGDGAGTKNTAAESETDQRSNADAPPRGGAPATGTARNTQVSTNPELGGDTP